jgi:hypothetical protein
VKPEVGDDIEAICGKCGDVWHVVFAKVGDKIAKVQCRQCQGYHKYRPPEGKPRVDGSAPSKPPRERSAPIRLGEKPAPRRRVDEPKVAPNLDKEVQPYLMTSTFEVGDRIQHKSFGQGVVEELTGENRISVFFAEGRKVLVHRKR